MIESCGIIGAGKVGFALIEALKKLSILDWVVARSEKSYANASPIVNDRNIFRSIDGPEGIPDIIILSVDDKSIEAVSADLAEHFGKRLEGCIVAHCSGIENIELLQSCAMKGAKTASIHPYQTFFKPSADILKNIYWGIECREEDYPELKDFISRLAGSSVRLAPNDPQKAVYHGSAVAASNYLTMLISFSKELALQSGIAPEKFLPPIIRTTIENNLSKLSGRDFPLTGPIARADTEALVRHIRSIHSNPLLSKCYALLGLATIEISLSLGKINEKEAVQLKEVLKPYTMA